MFIDIGEEGQVVAVDIIRSGTQGSLEAPTAFLHQSAIPSMMYIH